MTMGKRPRKGGAEHEVFSRWRHYVYRASREGYRAAVKRRARQRERRQGRQRRWEERT